MRAFDLLLAAALCCLAPCCVEAERVLSVADLAALSPTDGRVLLRGYVVGRYTCPPCPPGALCKPCLGDHIAAADNTGTKQQPEVRIFCEQPDLFESGRAYLFRAEVRSFSASAGKLRDLRLLSFEMVSE